MFYHRFSSIIVQPSLFHYHCSSITARASFPQNYMPPSMLHHCYPTFPFHDHLSTFSVPLSLFHFHFDCPNITNITGLLSLLYFNCSTTKVPPFMFHRYYFIISPSLFLYHFSTITPPPSLIHLYSFISRFCTSCSTITIPASLFHHHFSAIIIPPSLFYHYCASLTVDHQCSTLTVPPLPSHHPCSTITVPPLLFHHLSFTLNVPPSLFHFKCSTITVPPSLFHFDCFSITVAL